MPDRDDSLMPWDIWVRDDTPVGTVSTAPSITRHHDGFREAAARADRSITQAELIMRIREAARLIEQQEMMRPLSQHQQHSIGMWADQYRQQWPDEITKASHLAKAYGMGEDRMAYISAGARRVRELCGKILTAPRHSERWYRAYNLKVYDASTKYRMIARRMRDATSSQRGAGWDGWRAFAFGEGNPWCKWVWTDRLRRRPMSGIGLYMQRYTKAWPKADTLDALKTYYKEVKDVGVYTALRTAGRSSTGSVEDMVDHIFENSIHGYQFHPLRLLHDLKPCSTDPTKVSYYESHAKVLAKRRTVTTPGRYLEKYFGAGSPTPNTESLIRQTAERWVMAHRPITVYYKDNTDPDGWEWVYANVTGFNSCMGPGEYQGHGPSAVRAYAHPDSDVKLAYITDTDKPDGRVVARAIVRGSDSTKGRARVYGDSRLGIALEAAGYPPRRYLLDKAVLSAIPFDNHTNHYYTPYVDAGTESGGGSLSLALETAADGKPQLRANLDGRGVPTGDRYCYAWTNFNNYRDTGDDASSDDDDDGYDNNDTDCEDCGDRVDSDDTNHTHEGLYVCQHCTDNRYEFAYVTPTRRALVGNGDVIYTPTGQAVYTGDGDEREILLAHNWVMRNDGETIVPLEDCVQAEPHGGYYHPDDVVALSNLDEDSTYSVIDRECAIFELFTGRVLSENEVAYSASYFDGHERVCFPDELPPDWMQQLHVTKYRYTEWYSWSYMVSCNPPPLPGVTSKYVYTLEEALTEGHLRGQERALPMEIQRRIPEGYRQYLVPIEAPEAYNLAA